VAPPKWQNISCSIGVGSIVYTSFSEYYRISQLRGTSILTVTCKEGLGNYIVYLSFAAAKIWAVVFWFMSPYSCWRLPTFTTNLWPPSSGYRETVSSGKHINPSIAHLVYEIWTIRPTSTQGVPVILHTFLSRRFLVVVFSCLLMLYSRSVHSFKVRYYNKWR
jgi:hypothetical protein